MVKKNRKRRPPLRQQSGRVPGGPALRTPEGDPVVFCTALFRHGGMDEVIQVFVHADDFDLGDDPEPGPDGVVQFGWVEVGPDKPLLPVPLERRILATLTLNPETLQIETMSEERLARCRRRLAHLLGDRLQWLRTERKSLAQMMAEGEPKDAPEPLILPPEAIADLQDRMLRQWLDESIPALDGMTPRQAVRTPEGRQMVLDLLDYIEDQQARHPPPPGMFSPDYRKVKPMLGLE